MFPERAESNAIVAPLATPDFNFSRFAAPAVLVLGVVLSSAAYRFIDQQIAHEGRSRFENECAKIEQVLERRLRSYADLLLGLRGLFRASGVPSRRDFHEYVTSLELSKNHAAVMSLNFAQHVTAASKLSFEAAIRRDTSVDPKGYPSFRINPTGERALYHVIVYLEPFERSGARFARDIRSVRQDSPGAAPLLDEGRDSGELVSSGRPIPGETGRQLGLRGATYEKGLPIDTVEQRRRAYIGTVGMSFSLSQLVSDAIAPLSVGTIHFRIHNIGRKSQSDAPLLPSDENLLIDSDMLPALAERTFVRSDAESLTRISQFEFGGRILGIYFDAPASSFSTPLDRALPGLALGSGIFISVLLYAVIWSLQRSRFQLEGSVRERTQALHEINRNLQTEIAERNRLEAEILLVGQEQRRRIGQELHDDLGQRLTAAAFLAESLARGLARMNSPEADEAFKIEKFLSEAVSQTRLLARGLFPVALEAGGIIGALKELAVSTSTTYRIRCQFRCDGPVSGEDMGVASFNLYRVAQEAVNNAIKHGKASSVIIELSGDLAEPRMAVTDNGVGFDDAQAQRGSGIGLQIMRYRCKMLGLGFKIVRVPDGGTTVCVGGPHGTDEATAPVTHR
jgi:signal transduction histidine kinase